MRGSITQIRRFLPAIVCLFLAGVFSSCAPAASHPIPVRTESLQKRLASTPVPSVLFIGNSYSFGLPKAFANVAERHGRRVRVAQSTHSGWTLARHAADAETLKTLRSEHWDIVVLQESSRIPSLTVRRRFLMFPAVRKLADEVLRQGALPVLYQTWARRDGDSKNRSDDFYQMNRRIREGYAMAALKSGNLPVIPVGDVWEREVRAGRGTSLFMPDGSHPSAHGAHLNAETFRQVLIGPGK